MSRKSKKPVRKQTHSPTGKVVGQVGQILLPMIAGIAATKADLTEWVYEQGLTALHLLLREDAEKIAGPKGKHEKERTHNHPSVATSSSFEVGRGGVASTLRSLPRRRPASGASAATMPGGARMGKLRRSSNPSVATSSSFEVGRGGVASTLRSLPRRRPASGASAEPDLGGGIDPKLRIESGQTLGEVEVSWHEQECRQPSPREPDD